VFPGILEAAETYYSLKIVHAVGAQAISQVIVQDTEKWGKLISGHSSFAILAMGKCPGYGGQAALR